MYLVFGIDTGVIRNVPPPCVQLTVAHLWAVAQLHSCTAHICTSVNVQYAPCLLKIHLCHKQNLLFLFSRNYMIASILRMQHRSDDSRTVFQQHFHLPWVGGGGWGRSIRIHIGLIDPWCQANRLSNGFQRLAGTKNKDDQKAPLPPPPGQTDRLPPGCKKGKDYPRLPTVGSLSPTATPRFSSCVRRWNITKS